MNYTNQIQPKQPFFLNATSHYCKHIIADKGISHFYAFVADDMDVLALGIPDDCIDIMYRCNIENPDIILSGTGAGMTAHMLKPYKNTNIVARPFWSKEKLTLEQAAYCYTMNSAKSVEMENKIGSLDAGKYADMIVLDRNIFEIPIDEVKKASVIKTIVNGKIVYENEFHEI